MIFEYQRVQNDLHILQKLTNWWGKYLNPPAWKDKWKNNNFFFRFGANLRYKTPAVHAPHLSEDLKSATSKLQFQSADQPSNYPIFKFLLRKTSIKWI